jgi:hypothetical protein
MYKNLYSENLKSIDCITFGDVCQSKAADTSPQRTIGERQQDFRSVVGVGCLEEATTNITLGVA